MRQKKIILWVSAFIVSFLILYVTNLFSDQYPVTGTIGINGKKVSYRFEKVHYLDGALNIIIRSDLKGLKGNIFWRSRSYENPWKAVNLTDSLEVLKGIIPNGKPLDKIEYYAELKYKEKKFLLPGNQKISLVFFGRIPPMLNVLSFLLLFSGLLLSIRTGLEYFNQSLKSRKFAILIVVINMTLTLLINPLYLTYKNGYMNHLIPSIQDLFPAGNLVITFLWIITSIILFRKNSFKLISILTGMLSIFVYIFLLL